VKVAEGPFYDLIQVLESSELKAVTISLKGSGKESVSMLHAMTVCRKYGVKSDAQLKQHWLANIPFPKSLSASKRIWYQSLLRHSAQLRPTDNPVRQSIIEIEFLAGKHLFALAGERMEPALLKAKELELALDGLCLVDLIRSTQTLNADYGFEMHKVSEETILQFEFEFLKMDAHRRTGQKKNALSAQIADSIRIRETIAEILTRYRKFKKSSQWQQASSQLGQYLYSIETHRYLLSDHSVLKQYLHVIFNEGLLQQLLGNHAGNRKAQAKLNSLLPSYRKVRHLIEILIFRLQLDLAVNSFDEKSSAALEANFTTLKRQFPKQFPPTYLAKACHLFSIYYIHRSKPVDALVHIKVLMQFEGSLSLNTLSAMAHLLHLVALYDCHDFEKVLSGIGIVKKKLKELKCLGEFEIGVLHIIQKRASGDNNKVLIKTLLTSLKKLPDYDMKINYFDFEGWVQAAEKGISMNRLFRDGSPQN
jgi:hypothetical protein